MPKAKAAPKKQGSRGIDPSKSSLVSDPKAREAFFGAQLAKTQKRERKAATAPKKITAARAAPKAKAAPKAVPQAVLLRLRGERTVETGGVSPMGQTARRKTQEASTPSFLEGYRRRGHDDVQVRPGRQFYGRGGSVVGTKERKLPKDR